MNSLKIKKNDKVVVLSGKDKGKSGKVLGTVPVSYTHLKNRQKSRRKAALFLP